MIGTSLNQYRITASIGAGGMGEVFRARDTRLNRDVAVKVLPKDFVADPDRLRRFEQEVKTLAALNHPNVLTIHDAGVHDGAPYLVSELLEGRTLREEMNGAALALRKATDYALQIAQGLAAAHGKGIIHRDLKPENIFVTKDGRVKILDFGLAKLCSVWTRSTLSQTEKIGDGLESVPTIRINSAAIINTTEPGMLLGTPAYMSPEQVRGEPADHRADIFAFGAVFYEMLSGTRAFRRNTPVESMNAVLNDTPSALSTADRNVPLALERIVERCLEKQPASRFQSADDLAFAIEAAREHSPSSSRSQHDSGLVGGRPRVVSGIAVLLLLALGTGWWFLHQSGKAGKKLATSVTPATSPMPTNTPPAYDSKSIAVLPFANLSPDKADEYLSDGITEELLNALARVPGLRVPGRSSSFAFKGRTEEGIFSKVGEQLRVTSGLEGSVRKAGNQLRIAAQLINVADGFPLWSETYDRDMTNIFAIQSDIATRVAEALKVRLLGAVSQRPTGDIEAYKFYLQGRQLWNRRTGAAITEAIGYFERAVTLDSSYALAYAGLADAYVILGQYAGLPAAETVPKARVAAQRALALNAALAEPRVALAQLRANYDWDWVGAEADFRQAIKLNPNYATAHHWLGSLLNSLARYGEALAQFQRGIEIDPLSPVIQDNVARGLFVTGSKAAAVAMLQKQISLNPAFPSFHATLGELWLREGRYSEAVAELEAAYRLSPYNNLAEGFRGLAYVRAGRTREAQQVLERLLDFQRTGRDFAVSIALIQHALGNDDEALQWLEKGAEQRSDWLEEIYASPHWDSLRSHPRVQAILRKMNLVK